MRRGFGTRGESWLRQAERAALLLAREVPASPRAGRWRRGSWCQLAGAARRYSRHRLSPCTSLPFPPRSRRRLPLVGRGGLPTPSRRGTHLFPPVLLLTLVVSLRYRSELLHFCLLLLASLSSASLRPSGESPNISCLPRPSPVSLSCRFNLAPGSSYPRTPILSSRHSREFSSHQNALSFSSSFSPWVGEPRGGGGERGRLRVQLPGVLFYSFTSFTFPFLLCVTFTYLLIYNRSGFFPFHFLVYSSRLGSCVAHATLCIPHLTPASLPHPPSPGLLFSFTWLPSNCTFSSQD